MGLFDDMQSRLNAAKRQLIETSGLDTEEAKQSINCLKQGLGGLSRQLAKSGRRLIASAANEMSDKSDDSPVDDAGNAAKNASGKMDDKSKSQDEAISCGGRQSSPEAETCEMDERLEKLRQNKASDSFFRTNLAEAPEECTQKELPAIEEALEEEDSKTEGGKNPEGTPFLIAVCIGVLLFAVLGLSTCSSDTDEDASAPASVETAAEVPSQPSTGSTVSDGNEISMVIECEENWLFSRYDIDMFVDGEWVGNLDHGARESYSITLGQGNHTLRIQEENEPSVDGSISFDASEYSEFRFSVHCTDSQVEIAEYRHVETPLSFDDAVGSQLSAVESSFRAAGFEEIDTTEEASLSVADSALAGTVKTVFIDGRDAFKKGEPYYSDIPVEIVFYSVGKIHPPRDSGSYEGMPLETVRKELETAGFSNIKVDGENEGAQNSDALVERVEIGMFGFLGFSTSDSFSLDEEVKIYISDSRRNSETSVAEDSAANSSASVLTIENCDDLAILLSQGETNAEWFASKYSGQTIEFDAAVWGVMRVEGSKTLYDVNVLAGNYDSTGATGGTRGPNFRFFSVQFVSSWCEPGMLTVGNNVHVVAEVGSYYSTQDWLELKPVKVTLR